MVTEDYVSFKTAKLLKEKGFDGKCSKVWIYSKSLNLENNAQLVSAPYFMEGEPVIDNSDVQKVLMTEERYEDAYLCPTIQMAMIWLMEVYHLWIDIDPLTSHKWTWSIWLMNDPNLKMGESLKVISNYKEACESAIKHCLKNLI